MPNRNSPGEGSIFQRRDGRWQASIMVAGVRRTVYGKTRKEAAEKLACIKQQAGYGALPNPRQRTVSDLLDAWLAAASPTLKPRTLHDYTQEVELHIKPVLGHIRLSRLEPAHIQVLLVSVQKQGHRRLAQRLYAYLHRACKLGVMWGWLATNPVDRVLRPQCRAERKELWTPEELSAFLTSTHDHWLQPLWVFLVATGCRLGEALALCWEDVDLQARTVRIGKTLHRIGGKWVVTEPKTKSAVRTITLPPEGMAALRKQRAQQAEWRLRAGPDWTDTGLVFTGKHGQPLGQSTVNHALRRECLRLGVHVLSAHSLRHLHASLLLAEGLPLPEVSRRLGHANPNITATIYAHAISTDDMAAQAIGRVLRMGVGR
jgi:integrase